MLLAYFPTMAAPSNIDSDWQRACSLMTAEQRSFVEDAEKKLAAEDKKQDADFAGEVERLRRLYEEDKRERHEAWSVVRMKLLDHFRTTAAWKAQEKKIMHERWQQAEINYLKNLSETLLS